MAELITASLNPHGVAPDAGETPPIDHSAGRAGAADHSKCMYKSSRPFDQRPVVFSLRAIVVDVDKAMHMCTWKLYQIPREAFDIVIFDYSYA